MPYFPLGGLGRALKEMPNQFTILLKLKIAIDLFTGLEYLHNMKIIHRNIKPNTLMVQSVKYVYTDGFRSNLWI
jgi:serine/threonine protein kinase